MKMIIAVLATMMTALLMPENGSAQTPQKTSTFTITGHAGQAQLLQINGKSYVEVEALARLTQGTLSFKANQTILTLSPSDAEARESTPHAKAGFSIGFVQAGIEEMSLIREWRIAIVNAVQSNIPLSEDWISTQHRRADKNLSLASAAESTGDDRSASALLAAEFSNMQKLSDLYLAMRKQDAAMSPDTFSNSSLEQQILSCAQDFVTMTAGHEFQDLPTCHSI
jgi:hypothetical protein